MIKPTETWIKNPNANEPVVYWACKCSYSNPLYYRFCGMCGDRKMLLKPASPPFKPVDNIAPMSTEIVKPTTTTKPQPSLAKGGALSVFHKLNIETKLTAVASSALSEGATVIDYATIKDKFNPKQKHYGFAPKANSQWHWFFVAKKTMTPTKQKGVYEFTLEFDKFQLAQGKALNLSTEKKNLFSYGCTGAKMTKTAARKKQAFLKQAFEENNELRTQRIEYAKAHKDSLKYQRGSTKLFRGYDGKDYPYFGMPIGGEHDWTYQDSDFVEQTFGANRSVRWRAKNVRWREIKVNKNRWALYVRGVLQAKEGLADGVKFDKESESLIIADQIATKLSPTSYHVAMKGVQLPVSGGNAWQREEDRGRMLAKIIEKLGMVA